MDGFITDPGLISQIEAAKAGASAAPAGVTPALVDAVIQAESGGDPNAVSRKGAVGLGQVMPATARDPGFGVRPLADPTDPAENRRFTTDYLSAMFDRYGDAGHALAAYNWGPGNVDGWLAAGADPAALPAETRAYVEKLAPAVSRETAGDKGKTSGPFPPSPQTVAENDQFRLTADLQDQQPGVDAEGFITDPKLLDTIEREKSIGGMGALERGAIGGWKSLVSIFGGAASAAGDAVNWRDLQKWGREMSRDYAAQSQQYAGHTKSIQHLLTDEGSFNDWLTWAAYNAASGGVTAVPALVAGLVAAASGPVGWTATAALLYGMGVGETYQNQLENSDDPNVGWALAAGIPYAVAEKLFGAGSVAARALTGKASHELAKSFMRRLLVKVPEAMADEAVAESVQQVITEGVKRLERGDSLHDIITDPKFQWSIVENAAAGAAGGAGFGALGAARGPGAEAHTAEATDPNAAQPVSPPARQPPGAAPVAPPQEVVSPPEQQPASAGTPAPAAGGEAAPVVDPHTGISTVSPNYPEEPPPDETQGGGTPTDTTGLASMGGKMASAMEQNLQQRLWDEYTGKATAIDSTAARARREAPGMTRDEFIAWMQNPPPPADIQKARDQVNTEPTDAQKEAGNYAKGHVNVHGLDVSIENPKGSTRRGTGPDGTEWESVLPADYGYIKRTKGGDGEQIDVYLGESHEAPNAYIVDQIDPETQQYDEHKVILGASSLAAAETIYNDAFSDNSGPLRLGAITAVPIPQFKDWLQNGDTTKSFAYQPAEAPKAPAGTPTPPRPSPASVPGSEAAGGAGPRVLVNLVGRDGKTDAERGGPLPANEVGRDPSIAAENAKNEAEPPRVPPVEDDRQARKRRGVRELGHKAKAAGEPRTPPEWLTNDDLRNEWLAGYAEGKAPEPQSKPDQEPPAEKPKAEKPKAAVQYGSTNKIITSDALKAAEELIRKKLGGTQFNSGIDPDLLVAGATVVGYHIEAGTRKFIDVARLMIETFGEAAIPYLRLWYNGARDMLEDAGHDVSDMDGPDEVRAALASLKEEALAPDSNTDLERDRGDANASDGVGAPNIPAAGNGDGSGAGSGEQEAGGPPDRIPNSGGLPAGDAPAVGESGDRPVREPASGDAGATAQSGGRERSGDAGKSGIPPDHVPAEKVASTARNAPSLSERRKAQKAAESVKSAPGLENIRETLPLLHPGQQEDVHKAEIRFAKPDGHGMLFTNGTGTGKTWSGAGIVKRFVRQGKGNVLIVVPSQDIAKAWQQTLKELLVDASTLESTSDAGNGVVVTTYANLGENAHLALRDWDLVIGDESQKLMQAQDGKVTDALRHFRAITNRPEEYGLRGRMRQTDTYKAYRDVERALDDPKTSKSRIPALQQQLAELGGILREAEAKWLEENPNPQRSKVVFLSATPFAYDKTVDYANGYLFDYGPEPQSRGYNTPDAYGQFFITHFGYRMRTGKLTKPDANVDTSVMERNFHEWLKREGALSGRVLDVEADYDRKFVLVEDGLGARIDSLLEFLWHADEGKFRKIGDIVRKRFDYLSRMRLLEAIKAHHAVPMIRKHHALGRKVVVFHDYNEGGGFNPFDFEPGELSPEPIKNPITGEPGPSLQQLYDDFIARNPDVKQMKFGDMQAPIHTLRKAFPNALVYNGTIPNKQRTAAREAFNDDAQPDANLIIVQSAAGEYGISLHDTTGVNQRAMINLGMPVRPVTAIQEEGRIYRTGQVTDALFRYFNTGTNWERFTFASRIAQRASTAENLALGNQARTLKLSFIDAFQNADTNEPHAGEGKGGKAADAAANNDLSEFDRAKTFYFAQQKTRGRRDQREGQDYFATPEPLGLKMVEWAGLQSNEHVLEPSAGHGAIARFLPEDTHRTLIEPSASLASRAALASAGAQVRQERFEDLHVANKYDAIVMNPPYGQGGKTALDHVAKAATHLRNGGRIVALIPEGPAADKRFEAFYESEAAKDLHLVADIHLPAVTFERAGTSVMTHVVVLEKQRDQQIASQIQSRTRDYRTETTIGGLFDRIQDLDLPPRLEPISKDAAPLLEGPSTISIAGAEWQISHVDGNQRAKPQGFLGRGEFAHAARVAERFGGNWSNKAFNFPTPEQRQQFLDALANPPAPEPIAGDVLVKRETKHAKTGENLYVAHLNDRVDADTFGSLRVLAKQHDGWYSQYNAKGAIPGFQFKSEEARQAFMDAAAGKTAEGDKFSHAAVFDETATLPPETVRAIEDSFARTLRSLGLPDVGAQLVEKITTPGGKNAAGVFRTRDGVRQILIASNARAPRLTLRHEAFHAMRELGLFTPAEWRNIEAAARREWRNRYAGVLRQYAGQPEDVINEEAAAFAFQDFKDGKPFAPGFRRIFARIQQFIERLGNALRGRGFQTPEDIFRRIESGKMATRARGGNGATDMRFAAAYHGSPHDFDQFDTGKIGTGEGAQAYGWGLYFAGRKGVAEHYRENLSRTMPINRGETVADVRQFLAAHEREARAEGAEPYSDGYRLSDHLHESGNYVSFDMGGKTAFAFVDGVIVLNNDGTGYTIEPRPREGRLYHVDLAPAEDEYLLWDKPLSEQSDKVKAALKNLGVYEEGPIDLGTFAGEKIEGAPVTGENTYRRLVSQASINSSVTDAALAGGSGALAQRAASQALRDAGIPGIKYLDGGSRADGDGSYNYVIFDASHVKVTEKYQLTEAEQQDLEGLKAGIGARPDTRSVKQKIYDFFESDFLDRLKHGVLDDLHGLKLAEMAANAGKLFEDSRSAYKLARLSRGINDVIMQAMTLGAPVWNDGTTDIDATVKAPMQILEEVGRERAEDFEAYMAARRAQELAQQGRENHFTEAQIRAGLALGDANPDFANLFGDLQTYNDRLLDFVEASGLVSPETRAFFAEMHKNYVPFYRLMEEGKFKGPKARLGFAGQHPNFFRLKGGRQNIERPLLAYERNVHRLIEASVKNVVMLRLEQMNAQMDEAVMTPEPRHARPGVVTNRQMIDDLAEQGIEITADDHVRPDDLRVLWTLGHAPKGDNVVSLVRGGKPRYYSVADPMLFRSLTMMHRMTAGWVKPFKIAKNTLTAAVGLDPSFQVANWIRDTMHVSVITHQGFIPVADSARGAASFMRDLWQKDPNSIATDFFQAGGGMSSLFEADQVNAFRAIEDRLKKDGIGGKLLASPRALLRALEHFESTAEYSTRVGMYRRMRAKGASRMEAAYQAREASTDFALRGSWEAVRFLADAVPFLNARIQGLARTGRGGAENLLAFSIKGGAVGLASVLLYLAFRDDDRYKELPRYARDNYWNFWIADQHYRIPKPFEVGAIFATMPEMFTRLAIERDGKEFLQSLVWNLQENLNIDPVPLLLRVPLRQYSNWDEFRQRPIVPDWLSNLQPGEQFDERTPQVYVAAGRALGISPLRIKAMMEGFFGAWAGYTTTAADSILSATLPGYPVPAATRWFEWPAIRRFVAPEIPRSSRYLDEFYQMRNDVDTLYATIKHLEARGEIDRARKLLGQNRKQLQIRDSLHRLNEQLQTINRSMRVIQTRDTLTATQKRDQLDRLQEIKNRVARMSGRLKQFYDE